MIKFEGFELKNIEDAIINRQPRTQPNIVGQVLKPVMKALGAKEGSSSWDKKSFLTEEQQELHKDTMQGYKDLQYQGPGEYKSGQSADDLEGFKAKGTEELRSLQDEGNLSLSGLDKLRNMRADAATRVNPDIKGMRDVAKNAWSSRDAHMRNVYAKATEELQKADIETRRRGMTGGTALSRLSGRNVSKFAETTTNAAAMAAERTAMERQALQLRAFQGANQAQMGLENLNLQARSAAGNLQLGQNQLAFEDLKSRRNLAGAERQFEARHGLDVARFSEEQAQNQNLWATTDADRRNRFALDRLRGMHDTSTIQTFKNVKNVKKGTSGIGGALITGGAAVLGAMYGGPGGAQVGAALGQGIVGGMGYDDGGGAMGQAIASGAQAYQGWQGGASPPPPGFNTATGTTTGVTAPPGYNAVVPPRAKPVSDWGYGTGSWGEFGDPTGGYNYSGVSPEIAMGGLNEPMGMNTVQHQSWRLGMGGARPMAPNLVPAFQP